MSLDLIRLQQNYESFNVQILKTPKFTSAPDYHKVQFLPLHHPLAHYVPACPGMLIHVQQISPCYFTLPMKSVLKYTPVWLKNHAVSAKNAEPPECHHVLQ